MTTSNAGVTRKPWQALVPWRQKQKVTEMRWRERLLQKAKGLCLSLTMLFLTACDAPLIELTAIQPVPSSGCEWWQPNYLSEDSITALVIGRDGLPPSITATAEYDALLARWVDAATQAGVDPDTMPEVRFLNYLRNGHQDVRTDMKGISDGNLIGERICPDTTATVSPLAFLPAGPVQ